MLNLSKNEPEKKEYFFALEINIDRVKSAIWTIEDNQAKLVSLGKSFNWDNEEKLLEVIDSSLSSAVEKIIPQQKADEPKKIIFGVSTDWVDENKIIPGKIEILKKISQKFELSPLGFIVIPEGVVHWLKKIEGVPPTAVLMGLSEKKISVSLVDLGKIIGTNLVVRSGDIGADLAEGLSRFNREVPFPARILLYDGEEKLEGVRQGLINWPWQEEKVSFLHLPKVEILSADFDIKAIVLASAFQMADIKGIELLDMGGEEEWLKEKPVTETGGEIEEENEKEEIEVEQEVVEEKKRQGEDVEEKKPETLPISQPVLGFVRGRDIKEEKQEISYPSEHIEMTAVEEEKGVDLDSAKPSKRTFRLPAFNFSWFKKINFSGFFSSIKNPFSSRTSLVLGLAGGVLLIVLVALTLLYWYFPKASVVLFVKPQSLERDFSVKLATSLDVIGKDKLLLPAQKIEMTLSGEKERETSGSKLIGEKATGEVTIYNRTSQQKTFSEGAKIYGPDDLLFTLDEDVLVASKSSSGPPDYLGIPGKAVVSVTAVEFGSEGNLASNSEFSIANYSRSDFIASNASSFSGGTAREVQVVAETDQDELLSGLRKELKQGAIGQLRSELGSKDKLVEESLELEVLEKTFSAKLNEEVNELSLKLELKVAALTFNEDDFGSLIKEEIAALVPSDFGYDPQQAETNFELEDIEDGIFTFTAHFKADLMPKFDLEQIKNNLLGKKPAIGNTYLSNLPNVESFEAQITPNLPAKIATFPRMVKKINIEVKLR